MRTNSTGGSRSRPRRRLGLEHLEDRLVLSGDMVLDWNSILLDAVRVDRTAPPRSARIMAGVHAAIYDAVNAIDRTHSIYLVDAQADPSTSREAAVAAAAHRTLSAFFPAQQATFDAELTNSLATVPDGTSEDAGIALGQFVADQILAIRSADGGTDVVAYTPGSDPGDWVPTPPGFLPALLPQWPGVDTWAMTRPDQFRPDGIPELTSQEYTDAFNEVKEIGRVDSTTRTQDQSEIALFWANGAGTSTPPGHLNVMAQQAAMIRGNTLSENARLFALLNIAQADAAIASWDAKYATDFWRPVTAIRNADTDGNPDTVADPTWSSFVVTPPFPAYTSGHSSFSGAAAGVLAAFFGTDDITFTLPSEDPAAGDRTFTSFSEAALDSALSRLYGGIHWSFDNFDGLSSGTALGEFVADNFLLPDPNQDSRWITRAYTDLLGRRGGGPEVGDWLAQVQSGKTRAQVIDQFLGSPEYLRNLVADVYDSLLGRAVEEGGLDFWSGRLSEEITETQFIAQVLASTEYADRLQTSGDNFVHSLYDNLLGRPGAGADELAFWNAHVAAGATPLDVALGFTASAEFLGLMVDDPADVHAFTGWYQNLLDRDADAAGRAFWQAMLAGGSSWEQVQLAILTSAEYDT